MKGDDDVRRLFDTHSHDWREVGLARQLSSAAVRRARIEFLLLTIAIVGVLVAYNLRREIFGLDLPVRIATVFLLLGLGWAFARDIGRAMAPILFRRLDPPTAGTVGFVIRLATVVLVLLVALRIAGLQPRTLAVGGAFTAVIVGLAAQQTFGNLFAGMVLLSARPFRVGDRVRLQGGPLAGQLEGVVASLGLLYTTFASGDDLIMVPNSAVLSVAVIPLREPTGVDLRARLRPGVTPTDVQVVLEEKIDIPLRGAPRVLLEEIDDDELVVRVLAAPEKATDGPRLATEVLAAIRSQTHRDGDPPPGAAPGG